MLAVCTLATAGVADGYRSNRGAKPSVRVLTKDERAAIRSKRIAIRVGVEKRARVHVNVLANGLDTRRPAFVTRRKTLHFAGRGQRRTSIRLTRSGRKALERARARCRAVRITAFMSSREIYPDRPDSKRTTLVRASRTLRPRRKGCRKSPPGLPPDVGGPDTPGPKPPPKGPIAIKAGAADADITPPVGTPMFAYTARSNIFEPSVDRPLQIIGDPDTNLYAKTFLPSKGIHARVRSRAIVIENAGKKYALVQADLGGLPYAMTQEVLKRIASTGITGDRLLLSATHTHSSSGAIWSADNMGYGLVGGDAYDPRIFNHIAGAIAEAIITADKRRVPARIGVGTAELRGASRNRNFDPFRLNPETPKDETAARAVSFDPRVTVIRVDAGDGSPLGVWSNFAIHPTSFGDDNLLFSGDNAATTERFVEQEVARDGSARGAKPAHPPVNVWTNANEGDISPNGNPTKDPTLPENDPHAALEYAPNSFGEANLAGRRVAEGVLAAWHNAAGAMTGTPAIDVRRTFMALDGTPADGEPVGPVPVLGAGGIVADDGTCAPADNFAGPGQGHKFPLLEGPGSVPIVHPVSMMRIGPLAIAAFPSEITKTMGARIRSAIAAEAGPQAAKGSIIAGLTNSYNSYTATPEEYEACHYEGSFTLWGRRQGSRYRDLARVLAKSLFAGGPAPASAPEPPEVSPGTGQPPSVRSTPDAGTVADQVPDHVERLGRVVFRWNGGDPAIDAPRGKAFVTLERRSGDRYVPVGTEDSVLDTTRRNPDDTWTETWQFTECDALGTYRFVVRGLANTGGGTNSYRVESKPFDLRKHTGMSVFSKTIAGGVAHVRAEYTGLPSEPLAALPLRVRSGFAVLRLKLPGGATLERIALPDRDRLEFTTPVPSGATIQSVSIEDDCGNSS
jgi:neutral ceramidase